jgi:hypothetical protein
MTRKPTGLTVRTDDSKAVGDVPDHLQDDSAATGEGVDFELTEASVQRAVEAVEETLDEVDSELGEACARIRSLSMFTRRKGFTDEKE